MHQRAARSEDTLRLSCDAKAPVLIGPFSRGGKSRRGTKGADHDFKPWGKLTPFGIFLPDQRELNFYFTSSKVTSDFIVDRLDQWWQGNRERYPQIRKLLLDLDANRQRIANLFPPAHRLVFVASERQLIASIGGGGKCCSRHFGAVCSRSSAACIRASVLVTRWETSQIARENSRLAARSPASGLTRFRRSQPAMQARNRHESASKVSAPADIQVGDGVAEHYPSRLSDALSVRNLDNGPENHSHRSQFIYRLGHLNPKTHSA